MTVRYKTMIAETKAQIDRILALCDRYGVAYYVDTSHDSIDIDRAHIHLMKCSDAIEYKRKGGIWSYYIPDRFFGVSLPLDR